MIDTVATSLFSALNIPRLHVLSCACWVHLSLAYLKTYFCGTLVSSSSVLLLIRKRQL